MTAACCGAGAGAGDADAAQVGTFIVDFVAKALTLKVKKTTKK